MSNIKNLSIHQKTELPSNIEAEQTLIGSILENNEMFDEISDIVTTDHFYDDINKKIYSVANALEPGSFDLSDMASFSTVGITFFFTPDEHSEPIPAFDKMLKDISIISRGTGLCP